MKSPQAHISVCVSILFRLRLVFPWLVSGFASQLECQELLLLWDRILGFDSLDILAGTYICTYQCFPQD